MVEIAAVAAAATTTIELVVVGGIISGTNTWKEDGWIPHPQLQQVSKRPVPMYLRSLFHSFFIILHHDWQIYLLFFLFIAALF